MDMERRESGSYERLANGLGWFSIGLGLAELLAPDRVAQLIGVPDDDRARGLLRTYGMRELVNGMGILMRPDSAALMWGRVGGDLLDIATLTSQMSSEEVDRSKLGMATAAVAGVTALDIVCARGLSMYGETAAESQRKVVHSISVNKSPDEVYGFWRNFENFPSFMDHLQSVQVLDERRSRWRAIGPMKTKFEWDAEIVDDAPGSRIAWRSLEGADVYNAGTVTFERAPGDRGTLVRVEFEYAPPGGAVAAQVAKLFGREPSQQVDGDLRRFKQIMETGEVVKSDASIHSGMHPAQPPA